MQLSEENLYLLPELLLVRKNHANYANYAKISVPRDISVGLACSTDD